MRRNVPSNDAVHGGEIVRIPNFIREFFLLQPRPPERPVRRTGFEMSQPPRPRKKRRDVQRDEPDTMPKPEVMRKKVRVGKADEVEVLRQGNDLLGRELVLRTEGLGRKWFVINLALQRDGQLRIGPQDHLGKLRGVDILVAARRQFRRAGIPVDIKLCGRHGFISLRDPNSNQ